MISTFVEPQEWAIETAPENQAAAWQFSRSLPSPAGQWTAYLNKLCLDSCLAWLREYLPSANAWTNDPRSVWNVVNGSVVTVGTKRIALIPTEAIDQTELEVPQEWVDIPDWAADYYLAVQVAAGEIRIYGYATHQQLKAGSYDAKDRTYCLDVDDLNPDLNALWLTYDRFSSEQTKAALAPIPVVANADRLIERLSDPAIVLPRLEVPFTTWAGLLDDRQLRQRLYQPTIRLNRWLQGQIDAAWQLLDTVLLPQQIATAVRSPEAATPAIDNEIHRAKVFDFAAGQIALVVGISPVSETERRIRLQIHPAGGSTYLPGSTQLRLLGEDGSEIGRASAAVTETMQLQFRAMVGEPFQVEIICDGQAIAEQFVL